ncbi:PilN domain-containing protein [Shewanella sp. JM162201]|uniref:PilN domain-containing protein n=1 Tax=Shewanella jiangmenensis TaxID=2837387 RepID=A0ABS5V0V7_9GAMM|nr:PilN domain-containing protein [Shewanella jiangmenensis]MBT1444099.1 PilN domain-containing protein [Shewanella jiangmenensis]
MSKSHINLYDDSLLPARQRLSFDTLKLALISVLLLLLLGLGGLYWQLSSLKADVAAAQTQQQELTAQKLALEQRLQSHQPDVALVAEVNELQESLELKRLLLGEIGKQQRFTSKGYGDLLTDLASAADGSLWLERIVVAEGELRFEGSARDPKSVPLWVERLKETKTLQGKQFATMTMAREDGKPLGFVLTSSALAKETP